MKKLISLMFSMKFAGMLLLLFAAVIGTATFIENDHGTAAAKDMVYSARWFEILLFITTISLTGSIFKYKLWQRKKFSVLFFHLAFVIIMLGAFITRYFGYEGIMKIREGETTNEIITLAPYVQIWIQSGDDWLYFDEEENFSSYKRNSFRANIATSEGKLHVKFKELATNGVVFTVDFKGEEKEILVPGKPGMISKPRVIELGGNSLMMSYGSKKIKIPFSVKLIDFRLDRYPGSMSPSSFLSEVVVIDPRENLEMPYEIYMNNVLNYGGFRFFQSSYDKDELGTVLSVNHDKWGTLVTYLGYFVLTLGLFLNFFSRSSRFQVLARNAARIKAASRKVTAGLIISLIVISGSALNAQSPSVTNGANVVDRKHAALFGSILVQGNDGRIEPINTLSSEILRKVYRKNSLEGLNPDQVFLGLLTQPSLWQEYPMIKVSDQGVKQLIGISGTYASFLDFLNPDGSYKLSSFVDTAYNKKPVERDGFDKDIINVDERVNIMYMVFTGDFMTIFPRPDDPNNKWFTAQYANMVFDSVDAGFVENILPVYYTSVREAMESGNWETADEYAGYIQTFQQKYGGDVIPPAIKTKLEILYNKANIFKRLLPIYSLLGLIMLIMVSIKLLSPKVNFRIVLNIIIALIAIAFLFHTAGLAMRWYIAGRAPWSNGYETMIYISWGIVLSGFIFLKNSKITLATTAILASITLMVANMSWLNPEITNLVPVLKSYWLVIHVAVITASYSFLAIGALLGFLNLLLIIFVNSKNKVRLRNTLDELTNIIEMNLIIGVFLITIGTFLGAVWANESWGRYWGWDPKETWALVTVLVYSFVVHMRMIPGLNGLFAFNFASLISFSTVLMTYFGVNYFLSGMHSYAAGDAVKVPSFVYYSILVIAVVSILGYLNYRKALKAK